MTDTLPGLSFGRRIAFWSIPCWLASFTFTHLLIAAYSTNLISSLFWHKSVSVVTKAHVHKAFVDSTILEGVWRFPDDFRSSQQSPTCCPFSELFRFLKLHMHQKNFDGSGIKLLSFLAFNLSFFLFPLHPPSGLPRNIYWLFAPDCH